MRTHPLIRRVAVVLLAIVQMGALALASVGDARLLQRNDRIAARSHAEDHTRRSCAAVDPDGCALCQFLSHLSAVAGDAASRPLAVRDVPGFCDAAAVAAVAADRTTASSRAPPVV